MLENISKCPNCGGALIVDQHSNQVLCEYCKSKFTIDTPVGENKKKPEGLLGYIPFNNTETNIKDAVLKWLAGFDDTPVDLLANPSFQFEKAYIPCYIYDGEYNGSWSASSGYIKEEPYTEYIKLTKWVKDKGIVEYTEPRTAYKRVPDWRPSSAPVSGSFHVVCMDSESCAELPKELMDSFNNNIQSIGRQNILPLSNLQKLENTVFECKVTPDAFHRNIGEPQIIKAILEDISGFVPGDTHSDLHWSGTKEYTYSIAYLPFWTIAYEYQGKPYSLLYLDFVNYLFPGRRPITIKIEPAAPPKISTPWTRSQKEGCVGVFIFIVAMSFLVRVIIWLIRQ